MAVKYADARRFALSLPGVSEEPHFGIPSFRVNKRMLVTVPPGNMLHVFVADAERDLCLAVYAGCTEKVFWGGKVVGIRIFLDKATRGAVEDMILRAWKYRAAKKDVAAYAAGATARATGDRRVQREPPATQSTKRKATRASSPANAASGIDAYIGTFPATVRARLGKVRATIRKAAPGAEEAISYGIPAYKLDGNLIYFAGFAQHIGIYPAPRAHREFRDELAAYAGGKGTVRLPHDAPLPLDLIKRIVEFRVAENRARAAARKKPGAVAGARSPRARQGRRRTP